MQAYRDPLKAGLLSSLMPGAGQAYAGAPARGLTFLMGTATGLFLFVVPGVVIWITAVADAVAGARRHNRAAPPLPLPPEISPVAPVVDATDGHPPASRPGLELR